MPSTFNKQLQSIQVHLFYFKDANSFHVLFMYLVNYRKN